MNRVGPRHDNSVRHQTLTPRTEASQEEERQAVSSDPEQSTGRLLIFTIDANTAQIVKLETQDANGARRELSDEEKTTLGCEGSVGRLEDVIEQAFAAGIACVLGEASRGEHAEESAGGRELPRLVVAPLIDGSGARLLQHEALNRILLQALIQRSMMKPHPGRGDTSSDGLADGARDDSSHGLMARGPLHARRNRERCRPHT